MTPAEFDRFASSYDQNLAKSLAITGEGRDFYAQGRIDWTAQCVARLGCEVRRILDYGCGDGAVLHEASSANFLLSDRLFRFRIFFWGLRRS